MTQDQRRERLAAIELEDARLRVQLRRAVGDPMRYGELAGERTALLSERARLIREMERPPGTGTDRLGAHFARTVEEERRAGEAAAVLAATREPGPNERLMRRMEEAGLKVDPAVRLAAGLEREAAQSEARARA